MLYKAAPKMIPVHTIFLLYKYEKFPSIMSCFFFFTNAQMAYSGSQQRLPYFMNCYCSLVLYSVNEVTNPVVTFHAVVRCLIYRSRPVIVDRALLVYVLVV